jgi:hypothetical protein
MTNSYQEVSHQHHLCRQYTQRVVSFQPWVMPGYPFMTAVRMYQLQHLLSPLHNVVQDHIHQHKRSIAVCVVRSL